MFMAGGSCCTSCCWCSGSAAISASSTPAGSCFEPDLTPPARATALKIMSGLDLGPKICLMLFLPSGITLMSLEPHGATLFGITLFPAWFVVLPGCSHSAGSI